MAAEQNYAQNEHEAPSLEWGILKFHQYLIDRHFLRQTDHQPLQFLFNPQKGIQVTTTAQLHRSCLFLSAYDYEIKFCVFEPHANCDGLSRLPSPIVVDELTDEVEVSMFEQIGSCLVITMDVAAAIRHDPVLSHVAHAVLSGCWREFPQTSEHAPYVLHASVLSLAQGCVMSGMRVVIPASLRQRRLKELHEGHFGVVKMKMF